LNESITNTAEIQTESANKLDEIDANKVSSQVLARLIEEVRNEEIYSINAYNRMHNRHNRSR